MEGAAFADVWMRGHFAWEYKGKHKNLDAAYQQLLQYKEDLENPPSAGGVRPRPLRGAYQLHQHRQARLSLHPGRPLQVGQYTGQHTLSNRGAAGGLHRA